VIGVGLIATCVGIEVFVGIGVIVGMMSVLVGCDVCVGGMRVSVGILVGRAVTVADITISVGGMVGIGVFVDEMSVLDGRAVGVIEIGVFVIREIWVNVSVVSARGVNVGVVDTCIGGNIAVFWITCAVPLIIVAVERLSVGDSTMLIVVGDVSIPPTSGEDNAITAPMAMMIPIITKIAVNNSLLRLRFIRHRLWSYRHRINREQKAKTATHIHL
jgi:hypothetical protein